MSTLFRNNLSGTLSATAAIGATSLSSAGFANLPVVSSPDVMWLTLDPEGTAGAPEIVQVTAHTASATTVTVVRAQQGTSAREHLSTVPWVHALTRTDIDALVSTGTTNTADIATNTADIATNTADIATNTADIAALETATATTAWTGVTFQNSWSNYGSGYQNVQYRKVGDMVQIRGTATGGTVGVAMFTLPSGYRPPATLEFPGAPSTASAITTTINVATDGTVVVNESAFRIAHTVNIQFSVTA